MSAVVLFSGGLDSTVCLAWALEKFEQVHALSFDYGQKNKRELVCADAITAMYRSGLPSGMLEHFTDQSVWCTPYGGTTLLGKRGKVPEGRTVAEMRKEKAEGKVPSTYVPFRNGIMLAHATAFALGHGCDTIVGGWNGDGSAYPDSQTQFLRHMQRAITAGIPQDKHILIQDPICGLLKKDVIAMGKRLEAPIHLTMSCYNGVFGGCGNCDSCALRMAAFGEAGCTDHARDRRNITALEALDERNLYNE